VLDEVSIGVEDDAAAEGKEVEDDAAAQLEEAASG
jgi:hypothetical protein